MPEPFRIGISNEFLVSAQGKLEPALAAHVDPLPHVVYRHFEATGRDEQGSFVRPEDLTDCDAAILFLDRFTPASFAPDGRLAILARWGVGYDRIDVPACTAAGVLLAITVDAVRRPVAEAILTLILALAYRLMDKDRIVRTGRWDLRAAPPAVGLEGKVVGSIGLGNIGGELFRLLAPFGLGRMLAADPYANPAVAAQLGVELVDLETLARESDFIAVNCPLTAETQGLVNARLLGMMKPTAYLINTARGPIVNQDDLVDALASGKIAGAGLDVFDAEPLPTDHPLTHMENVILSPHSLAWTDHLYQGLGLNACENIFAVLRGELPRYIVNREVAQSPRFQAKQTRLRQRWQEWTAATPARA